MTSDGQLVAGRYRLLGRLGTGGMGTVWRAEDLVLARQVAIKEVAIPHGLSDADVDTLRERTRREARSAARLRHPSAVTIYDVVEEDGRPWLVMELVEARTLAEAVRDEGPLTPQDAARVGLDVLSALQAAHERGIVHRDVKPSNVLLGRDGRVVLTDFGIATSVGDASITSTGLLLGSPAYIAPERARGQQPGPASDLWSLGATLFTAVEGRAPYDKGDAMPTLTAVITDDRQPYVAAGPLIPVLDGLLQQDPAARLTAPQAAQQLREVALRAPSADVAAPVPASDDDWRSSQTEAISLVAIAEQVAAAEERIARPVRRLPPVSPGQRGSARAGTRLGGATGAGSAAVAVPRVQAPPVGAPAAVSAEASTEALTEASAQASSVVAPTPGHMPVAHTPAPRTTVAPTTVAPTPVDASSSAPIDFAPLAAPPDGRPGGPPFSAAQEEPTVVRTGRSRRSGVLVGTLMAAVLAGAVILGLNSLRADDRERTITQGAPTAGASPGTAVDDSSATPLVQAPAVAAPAAPTSAASPSQPGDDPALTPDRTAAARNGDQPTARASGNTVTVPAGNGASYRDPVGWSVRVPAGWTVSSRGAQRQFRDARTGRTLRVDTTATPPGDAVADWGRQSVNFAQRYPSYRRIRIEPSTFRGGRGAEWEFTYTANDGSRLRVLDKAFVLGGRGYAIYWQVPVDDWEASQAQLQEFLDSFQPA